MPFDTWDDALFWHGSLIGYMAGVKAACKDKKKSELLLEMSEVQSKLEIEERKNAKLHEFAAEAWELLTCNEPNFVWSGLQKKASELGIEDES